MAAFFESTLSAPDKGPEKIQMLAYGFPILAAFIALFFLPAIVAGSRYHPNATAIFALNVLLGWTVVGWAMALVWALTSEDTSMDTR